jgi:hypothetical protein
MRRNVALPSADVLKSTLNATRVSTIQAEWQADKHPAGKVDFGPVCLLHKSSEHCVGRGTDECRHAPNGCPIGDTKQQRVLEAVFPGFVEAINGLVNYRDDRNGNRQQHHRRRRIHDPHADYCACQHEASHQ